MFIINEDNTITLKNNKNKWITLPLEGFNLYDFIIKGKIHYDYELKKYDKNETSDKNCF
jgi:hypothetical protein